MQDRKKIRFKGSMLEVKIQLRDSEFVAFEWAKLSSDNYLIYIPKIFRKQQGGSFAIISEKKMMKMLADNRKTQSDIDSRRVSIDKMFAERSESNQHEANKTEVDG